jgi:hypothetical protein
MLYCIIFIHPLVLVVSNPFSWKALIDAHLIPFETQSEAKVFYHKMKADYFRYVAEFSVDAAKTVGASSVVFFFFVETFLDPELVRVLFFLFCTRSSMDLDYRCRGP